MKKKTMETFKLSENGHWTRVIALTVILTLQTNIGASQMCENGTFYDDGGTTAASRDPTQNWTDTTPTISCSNCSTWIHFCVLCTSRDNCQKCESGYNTTDGGRNCTLIATTPKESNPDNKALIIGLVVGIGGGLVLAGVIVVVVCLVTRGMCPFECRKDDSRTPPPLPDPDLGASFKKDDQQGGTGQQIDLRYTSEPGSTPPRVQSVQYDEVSKNKTKETIYINSSDLAPRIEEQAEDGDAVYNNEIDKEGDDQIYINAPSPVGSTAQRSRKGSKPQAPNTKPKPVKASSKTTEKRTSLYPPTDNTTEDVYNNEIDKEGSEDEEDYVNTRETLQMKTLRN